MPPLRVILTDASSGLGAALARHYAAAGATLGLIARRQPELERLRVELRASGVKVVTICPGYVATPMTEKNPYPMPFRMSAEEAATKIASIITRGKSFSVIPWQMALVARVMHVLPDWLYDRLAARAPRKRRRSS